MITEDYVSFEVAELLKEKGFKEITQGYINADQEIYICPFQQGVYELSNKQYPYPTLQMACKWLRLEHNLYIEPMVIKDYDKKKLEYTYTIQDLNFPGSDDGIDSCKNWNTPEEAIGEAIKYCLEHLIK